MKKYFICKAALFVIVFVMLFSVLVIFEPTPVKASGTTYYVDYVNGDDENDGMSANTAWKTLDKVNSITFQMGDSILFKTGCSWIGQLYPKGSGTSDNPITISSYGTSSRPIIDGNGCAGNGISGAAVCLYNQQYWVIENIEITNDALESDYRYGVYVLAEDYGICNYIYLKNLYIHDIKGKVNPDDDGNKTGAIIVRSKCTLDTGTATRFNDVLIENCNIKTADYSGIRVIGGDPVTLRGTNVLIKNNSLEDLGGAGIVPIYCDAPLIEYNTVKLAGNRTGNVAIWPWGCDNAKFQYNEAYLTKYINGDAQGFDCDGDCTGTIFQYNYSHDNQGGFMLICTPSGDGNTGSIIRYNISQNDYRYIFHLFSSNTTDTKIYNNTIYIGPYLNTNIVSFSNGIGGVADQTYFYNNIFYNLGSGIYENLNLPTTLIFDHNCFFGNHPGSEPSDSYKITSDPKLADPGSGGTGRTSVDGYKLVTGSPCIDAGTPILENGGKDYWGTALYNNNPDIGAYEGTGVSQPVFTTLAPAPKPGGAFLEKGGTVCIETETALENTDSAYVTERSSHTWSKVSGVSCDAMECGPDNGSCWSDTETLDINSPELTYRIKFTSSGNYLVWLLVKAVDTGEDSVNIGMDDVYKLSNYSLQTPSFMWKCAGTINAVETGYKELNIWGREDGLIIDKIYLTVGREVPNGTGPTQSITEDGTIPFGSFIESNGEICIEAETTLDTTETTYITDRSSHTWSSIEGSSYAAMECTPDNGSIWIDTGTLNTYSPEMTYFTKISTAGNYKVWLMVKALDGSMDSVHIGLNNAYKFTNYNLQSADFSWINTGTLNNVPTGYNRLNIWAREDGLMIDKIYLTTGSETPSGTGPSESLREYPYDPHRAFIETSGSICMEAETAAENSFSAFISNRDNHTYSIISGNSNNAVECSLDNGSTWIDTGTLNTYSPEMTYFTKISTAGNYKVWLMVKALDGSMDSVHIGLNNTYKFTNYNLQSADFSWINTGTLYNVPAGYNQLNIWAREDGLMIDKIYLTTGTETPSGTGPSESLRVP